MRRCPRQGNEQEVPELVGCSSQELTLKLLPVWVSIAVTLE